MAERVEGLGAAPAKRHDHVPKLSLAEQEVAKREQAAQTQRLTHSYQGAGTSGGGDSGSVVPLLSKKDMKVRFACASSRECIYRLSLLHFCFS